MSKQNNSCYNSKQYWEDRYKEEDVSDWLTTYEQLRAVINSHVSRNAKILVLGCGNSTLSADMYNDGYLHITNIDYSQNVILNMQLKHSDRPEMMWQVMDITDLKYPHGSFDCVIDKATLDALLVDEKDPWTLSLSGEEQMDTILSQVSNVLCSSGVFISITFAQPHFRRPVYSKSKYNWCIKTETIGQSFHYYVFIMNKGKKLEEQDRGLEQSFAQRFVRVKPEVALLAYQDNEDTFFRAFDHYDNL